MSCKKVRISTSFRHCLQARGKAVENHIQATSQISSTCFNMCNPKQLRRLITWANLFQVSVSIEQRATFSACSFSIGPVEWCQGQHQVQGYAGYTCCAFSAGLSMAATPTICADRSKSSRRGMVWVVATGGWTFVALQVAGTQSPVAELNYGSVMETCCHVERLWPQL